MALRRVRPTRIVVPRKTRMRPRPGPGRLWLLMLALACTAESSDPESPTIEFKGMESAERAFDSWNFCSC